MRSRPRSLIVVALVATLVAAWVVAGRGAPRGSGPDPIEVGAGPEAESQLLAATVVALLELEDIDAEVSTFAEPDDVRQALELGAVELTIGYTGEIWLEVLGRGDPPGDPRRSFVVVRDHDGRDGLDWLPPTFEEGGLDAPPANATFSFVVDRDEQDLRTVSQLATRLSQEPDARVCVDEEFGTRDDGLAAVLEAYSVRSDRSFLAADPEEAVLGVAAGDCLAGLTTATDGAAWREGLRPLIDDLGVFPAFVVLPVVREDATEGRDELRASEVRSALRPLARELTTALLGGSNARVADGQPIDEVADDLARELRARAGDPVEEA